MPVKKEKYFNGNDNNTIPRVGIIPVNGMVFFQYVTDEYTRGQIRILLEQGKWYLICEEWWPACRGASNGGRIKDEINQSFLSKNSICGAEDFLKFICRGQFAQCYNDAMNRNDIIEKLSEILESLNSDK